MDTQNFSVKNTSASQSEAFSLNNNTYNKLPSQNKAEQVIDNQSVNDTAVVNSANDVNNAENTLSPKNLDKVAQQLQSFMSEMNRGLEFSVDEDSGRDVIKVIDKESGETVKQFPSEQVLDIVSKLAEATGVLVDFKI